MVFTVITETEKRTFGEEKALVLLNMCLPKATGDNRFTKSFNRFYSGMGKGFLRFAEAELQKRALLACGDEGFVPYGAVLKSVVSVEEESFVSLYTDTAVTAEGKRKVHRLSQLWCKETGTLQGWDRLFAKGAKRGLLPLILDGIKARSESAGVALYSDWESLAAKRFKKEQFYLCPQGIVFFYGERVLSDRAEIFPVYISGDKVLPFLSSYGRSLAEKAC